MPCQKFVDCPPASESATPIASDPPTAHNRLATSAQTHLNWGRHYCRQQRFTKAIHGFTLALQQYTRLHYPVGIGRSLNGLSAVYLHTQQYRRAQACSQTAIATLESTTARSDYALAIYQLGVAHLKLNQLSEAESFLKQASTLYHALPDPLNEDRVLLHLGQLYMARQECMFALACYEAVLDSVLMRLWQDTTQELLLTVLKQMMQLCEHVYGGDCAIVPFQQVLDRYIASGNRQQIAQLLRQLGQFHESQQRYQLALECYAQALKAMPPKELT